MTPPSPIAHYNLLDRLGEGGIGEVFRARDTKVGRTVALKIVAPAIAGDPERMRLLLGDAAAAAALSHPNIATLWDAGEAEGFTYLAYEHAVGRRLREEAGGAAMHPRRALDLAIQIADGVADAHSHGVIHGDLRPDTIVVTTKGSAKILDFGLAPWTLGGAVRSRAAQAPDTLPPESSSILAYLSPEQALGGSVDPRTDVFSLGTITYELLTGRNPFTGATPSETIVNVIQGPVWAPSEVNASVPKDVDAVIGRALTRDLSARQQSAAAFAAELRSLAAMLDVRTGDVADSSALLPLDDAPDRQAAGMLTAALAGAAALAILAWWLLSRS